MVALSVGESANTALRVLIALVVTAIVIAFAMTAVSIVLAMRSRSDNHSDHVDAHEPDDDLQDERVPPRQGEDRA